MGDWPIKEYLKKHLNNKRNYKGPGKQASAKGKGNISRYNIALDDIYNFGSEEDAMNEDGEMSLSELSSI